MKKILAASMLIIASQQANAIAITVENNAELLANTIAGSGITTSNAVYTGSSSASGFFTDGLSSIGINNGVLLTTGSATAAIGPNSSNATSFNNGVSGDSDLDSIISGTRDASVLEFDFSFNNAADNNLFMSFAFGSEEYNEFVGSSFNDVFGFFLDGVNIALLPGTSTPVSINNVNNGLNSSYFIDNTSGLFDVEYDGFTSVIELSVFNLSAGTHTMKFAIADVGDSSLDSGVFIQAASFSSVNPGNPVPVPGSLALIALGLAGLAGGRKLIKA